MNFYELDDLLDYSKAITNTSKIAGTEEGNWELKPIEKEDTARYAADDVVNAYIELHKGRNPLRIGNEQH